MKASFAARFDYAIASEAPFGDAVAMRMMAAKVTHIVLTEAQLAKLAEMKPDLKKMLEDYRARRAAGERLFIITDRHGHPSLSPGREDGGINVAA